MFCRCIGAEVLCNAVPQISDQSNGQAITWSNRQLAMAVAVLVKQSSSRAVKQSSSDDVKQSSGPAVVVKLTIVVAVLVKQSNSRVVEQSSCQAVKQL